MTTPRFFENLKEQIKALPRDAYIRNILLNEVSHAETRTRAEQQKCRDAILRYLNLLPEATSLVPHIANIRASLDRWAEMIQEEKVTFIHTPQIVPLSPIPDDNTATIAAHITPVSRDEIIGLPRIADYQIVREIGRGGMGVVYEAHHKNSGERLALKQMLDTDPEKQASFLKEAEAASRVSHPNVVRVLGVITDQESPTMVCEYVEGMDGDDFCRAEVFSDIFNENGVAVFSPLAATMILEQMNAALTAAHLQNVIHQDIKPSNFIFQSKGIFEELHHIKQKKGKLEHDDIENTFGKYRNIPWIKLADFGMAVPRQEKVSFGNGQNTYSVKAVPPDKRGGTLMYMAPEQIIINDEESHISGRTDVFALGFIYYQLLTGQSPKEARHYGEGLSKECFNVYYTAIASIMKSDASHAVDPDTDPYLSPLHDDIFDSLRLLKLMLARDKDQRITSRNLQEELKGRVSLGIQWKLNPEGGPRSQEPPDREANPYLSPKMLLYMISLLLIGMTTGLTSQCAYQQFQAQKASPSAKSEK